MDELQRGIEVGFSLFFAWGKKLITVSFRTSVRDASVCHRADQVIFRFQFLVVTDMALCFGVLSVMPWA